MPKAKTRKIVTKRFKITKSGKLIRKSSRVSHLKRKDDSSARQRKKRAQNFATKGFVKKIKKMVIN